MATKRVNVKAILANADLRRELMVSTIQATQAREGIDTSPEQADRAYYIVTEAERATFFELNRFKGAKRGEQDTRHEMFVKALRGEVDRVRHDVARRDFGAIDGHPLAFERVGIVAPLFHESLPLEPTWGVARQGKATGDDSRWVRYWWEVQGQSGWLPFAKGGEFSRFYSSIALVINWKPEQRADLKASGNALPSEEHYFKPGMTWPRRTQRGFNLRLMPEGCIFGDKGPAVLPKDPSKTFYLLGIANSAPAEFLLRGLMSFGSWEVGIIKRLPIPQASGEQMARVSQLAKSIHDAKRAWDSGNELSTSFERPWVLRSPNAKSFSDALDLVLAFEVEAEEQIQTIYNDLNTESYRLYGIPDAIRAHIERSLGDRPPEVIWPQMEGKSDAQKRIEHVWRLLSFTVKSVIETDADGIVSFSQATGETRLVDRVRQELAALFPGRDESQLEVEIVNELKRGEKGYRKCASLDDWLANAFFEYHASLYKKRSIIWHIASSQGRSSSAFGALCHYHKFDANRMAKLRAAYLRDAIEAFRREAALADQGGHAEDRVELQAKVEEVQALDKTLQQIQEGHHEGPQGGAQDFRILTPWKGPARPRGWNPDLDDGVKANLAPLNRAGVLRVTGVAG